MPVAREGAAWAYRRPFAAPPGQPQSSWGKMVAGAVIPANHLDCRIIQAAERVSLEFSGFFARPRGLPRNRLRNEIIPHLSWSLRRREAPRTNAEHKSTFLSKKDRPYSGFFAGGGGGATGQKA